MKKFFMLLGLALLTTSAHAQTSAANSEARRVFDEMRAKYSALNTYSMTMVREIFSSKGTVETQESKYSFAEPNRYSLRSPRADGEAIQLSDGVTAYYYFPSVNPITYFSTSMPPEILGRTGILQFLFRHFFKPILAGVDPFAPPWGDSPLSVTFGEPAVIHGAAVDAVVIRLASDGNETQTYFIGKDDRLLYRVSLSSGSGDQSYTVTETYKDVRLNPNIPADTFTFTPPPNSEHGDEFQHFKPFAESIKVGATPPPLIGMGLNGRPVDLADYRGKVVLLTFWASWCSPCWPEVPHVRAAYEKFREQGFEVIGISFDKELKALEEYVQRRNMPWPQIFDGNMFQTKASLAYKVRGLPSQLLIGRDGKVAAIYPRMLMLEPEIEKALARNL